MIMDESRLILRERDMLESVIVKDSLVIDASKAKEAILKSQTKLSRSVRMSFLSLLRYLGSLTSLRSMEIAMLIEREDATPTTVYSAPVTDDDAGIEVQDDSSKASITAITICPTSLLTMGFM